MEMPQKDQRQNIHAGHLGLVLMAALLLVGLAVLKNPSLIFKNHNQPVDLSVNPKEFYEGLGNISAMVNQASSAGEVAGASTTTQVSDESLPIHPRGQ